MPSEPGPPCQGQVAARRRELAEEVRGLRREARRSERRKQNMTVDQLLEYTNDEIFQSWKAGCFDYEARQQVCCVTRGSRGSITILKATPKPNTRTGR